MLPVFSDATKKSSGPCFWEEVRRSVSPINFYFVSTNQLTSLFLPALEFPRGLALLNHLHRELTKITLEDALGKQSNLITWFLIRASSPFLEVLSEFVSLGNVTDTTDPYVSADRHNHVFGSQLALTFAHLCSKDEFDLTKWSLYLTELSVSDGGDGLLARDFGTLSVKSMVPDFLHRVADQVIRLGVVQRVLQQSDSGSRKIVSVRLSSSWYECVQIECWVN